ncbi:MAG: hypothetical protein QMC32_00770 [Cytophagales bacterium]|jgi:hypothetical protein|tara:strand:+ start:281 stop:571 length:291 start_codon:yes stop_codon:yes gene_type:complete
MSNLFFINPNKIDLSISKINSLIDPIHFSSLLSNVLQTGKGVPQKRSRLKFQSTRFFNQLPNLPSLILLGIQLISLFNLINKSLKKVVFINQESNG